MNSTLAQEVANEKLLSRSAGSQGWWRFSERRRVRFSGRNDRAGALAEGSGIASAEADPTKSRVVKPLPGIGIAHSLKLCALASPAGVAAAPVPGSRATSLGALLGSHVLRDGELVLLILKPSFWFIVFNSIPFTAFAILLGLLCASLDQHREDHLFFELVVFVAAGRLMWATLEWMGRLYILTDQRVLSITGIFGIEIFDCPLRKVVRTRMISPLRERVVGVGTIEIIPSDEASPTGMWQTISRPAEIQEQLIAAINRSKQDPSGK
jgi:hypothetical protein